ncbi:hypothetical protein [Bacillus sp. Hm123]|uniref:hypothetical protein n=1 Tax=Bacillus sp. Hm123 TaxID=3450745 RepID=UPI003F42CA85
MKVEERAGKVKETIRKIEEKANNIEEVSIILKKRQSSLVFAKKSPNGAAYFNG